MVKLCGGGEMSRVARMMSGTGIYHVILRGINRQTVFEDEEDFERFIDTLERYKHISRFELYAYCLMENHIHFLIKEGEESLGNIIKRISSSYVMKYNSKYGRVGHLFQDRFKSEPVENERYFLTVLRYIFQNPLKVKLVDRIDKYRWSNYSEYTESVRSEEINFVLRMFYQKEDEAIELFEKFINQESNEQCMDISEIKRVSDLKGRQIIKEISGLDHIKELQNLDITNRKQILRKLKKEYNLSIRQIERLTGINRGVILKA